MQPFNTTIAALSTPPGKGGVALIRVSGADAVAVSDSVFRAKSGISLREAPNRHAIYGDVYADGETIDDAIVTVFRAPASYTGEDTVEFTTHGGMLIVSSVLSALYVAGATPAERGEFTRRAYLAGKLSLSEAEAIGELLDADTTAQIKLFRRSSRERLSAALAALYDGVCGLLSALCAKIDYPDEDLADLTTEELLARLVPIRESAEQLLSTYRTGRAVATGVRTVLLGKPNVGKSSLYNLLCRREAAIVTDVAGTTRDVLEERVSLGEILLLLADTAGIRETEDRIEKIGVSRSRAAAEEAELIFALFDGASPADSEDLSLIEFLDTLSGFKIALLNKRDLGTAFDETLLTGHVDAILPFSALSDGTEKLRQLTEGFFTDGSIRVGEQAILSSARQYAALLHGLTCLKGAEEALLSGMAFDAALCDLESALCAFAESDGRAVNDDVVSGIFEKFCVGK